MYVTVRSDLYVITHCGVFYVPLPKDNLFFGLSKEMTDEQTKLVDAIIDYHVVFSSSPAGTGKTTMSVASLYYLYQKGIITKVYYIFSPVEEDKMGFRPGDQSEKEMEYLVPLYDALAEIGQQPERALDPKLGWIEARSHTFLRGCNLKNAGVIIDEAQNWTLNQLVKGISRVKDDCHLVIIGHEGQIDLAKTHQSGFADCLNFFQMKEPDRVRVCNLSKNFRGWISLCADQLLQYKKDKDMPKR